MSKLDEKTLRRIAVVTKRYQQFGANVISGVWPGDKCRYCVKSDEPWLTCCERRKAEGGHQPMDCCDHCGSDHRNPYLWTYRGKYINDKT